MWYNVLILRVIAKQTSTHTEMWYQNRETHCNGHNDCVRVDKEETP